MGVGGLAADGEVEDYQSTIDPPVRASVLFVGQNTISTSAHGAVSVFAADVDGDGDIDVLSASADDNKIAWYENDGSGDFTAHTISTDAIEASSVFAADVDGDGDIDVLSASYRDDTIAWYENDGSEGFTAHTISTDVDTVRSVFAADIDGDGDIDVLSASARRGELVWYENDGSQGFTAHTISTDTGGHDVFAVDLDGDGDIDVLSASGPDDEIAWYENDGNALFTAHTISTSADRTNSVFAADVDGDGDIDVLSASRVDHTITWYENVGSQGFTAHVISDDVDGATSVFAADVDGDGDIDVLSASWVDGKIAWYENDGRQNFIPRNVNTPNPDNNSTNETQGSAIRASSVFAADVNGDGNIDVLSASRGDDKIAWYESFATLDFGDAPSPFPTIHSAAGAAHAPRGPTLGALRDSEIDGQPSGGADGDGADEDGVTFGAIRVGQIDVVVTVNVQNAPAGARLDAWIDFDGDGNWDGPSERIADHLTVVSGDNTLLFNVPFTALAGDTYARFRLSTDGNLSPVGSARDGEVEDYLVNIEPALTSRVGGLAWHDANGDGIRTDDEASVAAISVRLLDGDLVEIATTTTAEDGSYRFSEMSPGSYSVEFTLPEGFQFAPRGRGGDVSLDSNANRVTGRSTFLLGSGQDDKTRDVGLYDGPFPGDVPNSLRITEIRFNLPQFVELKNVGTEPIDLAGVRFIDGIAFDFTHAGLKNLFPGEYLVIVENAEAFAAVYETARINVVGQFEDVLDVEGERLELVAPINEVIQAFSYDPRWFAVAEREGFSLSVRDETSHPSLWDSRSAWRPSSLRLGSPGADDPRLTPEPGAVVINEAMPNPIDGFSDWIELFNTTKNDIEIGGWFIKGSDASGRNVASGRFRIPLGTTLAAGGYVVFTRDEFSNNSGSFTDSDFILIGETIHLTAGDERGELLGYSESATFGGALTGISFGRIAESAVVSGSFEFESDDVPREILRDSAVRSELDVFGIGVETVDVDVTLDITFRDDRDLVVLLTSPSGAEVVLFDQIGGSRDHFRGTTLDDEAVLDISDAAAPFDGVFRPHESLAKFDGENPNGIWTLTVLNVDVSHTGWLNDWSLTISAKESVTPSDFTALIHPTMGTANASAKVGPIIIDEILYQPGFSGDEFIELFNTSPQPINVGEWSLVGVEYVLPENIVIPAGGTLLVVPIEPDEFRAKHGLADDALVVGPYDGQLDDGGENLQLFRSRFNGRRVLIDRVDYDNDFPWPSGASEGGGSLQRLGPARYGNNPGNWTATLPTPGEAVFVDASVNPDLTGNGFVDFEDLTVLLAHWNQNVSAAEGNLVDAAGTPVNFEDLTVLLAAWTGPGAAGAPVGRRLAAAVGGDSGIAGTVVAVGDASYNRRSDGSATGVASYRERRDALRSRPAGGIYGLGRLQAAAVDRAMDEVTKTTQSRAAAIVRRRR